MRHFRWCANASTQNPLSFPIYCALSLCTHIHTHHSNRHALTILEHSLTHLPRTSFWNIYCNYILFNTLVSPEIWFVFFVHNPSNNIKQILYNTTSGMVVPMKVVLARITTTAYTFKYMKILRIPFGTSDNQGGSAFFFFFQIPIF